MLLYGPAGAGKTCVIKLAIEDLIKRKGVVIKFCQPGVFAEGLRIFREIQPKTPVIVLMEDIDSIIEHYCESDVINILDGVDMIEKVCFIATTNYPEKLGQRILSRPSRFDKRFKIGLPIAETRRIYLKSLMCMKNQFDINKWVEDTEGFSIAHLKELFVAVNVLGDKYENALNTLKEMNQRISSENDGDKMGLDVENE
jgi:ATP-dependent 26S proteasome regulatory subunit